MLKVTSTLKGLLALALGSFALGASAALPELSTDDAPKYYFIKNERQQKFVNAVGSSQFEVVSDLGNNTLLYEHAATLWYFVSAGEARNISCGDGSTHFMTPVYLKNLTQPGKAFNKFGNTPFTEEGTIYYLYELTQGDYSGYAIMKQNDDGVFRPANQGDSWHGHQTNGGYCAYYKAADPGSVFSFEAADETKVAGTTTNYVNQSKQELKASVNFLSKLLNAAGGTTTAELEAAIDAATTVEEVMNLQSTGVYSKLDRKVVYMVANGRTDANGKYIYFNKSRRQFCFTNHKCVLGKWQFVHAGDGNHFYLRNISSDSYMSYQGSSFASSATSRRDSRFGFSLVQHKADENGFVLKWDKGNAMVYLKSDYLGDNTVSDASVVTDMNASFSFEPANISEAEIAEDGLYVIRSKRGKVEEDSYYYNDNVKYPGSLITAYPADRELARKRVGYPNGAHLEIYAPSSVWKFVKDTENEGGWKIYSLTGEQTESAQNKGLKVVGDYVEVAAEPSTFYLKEVTEGNALNNVPNTYALCTAKDGGKYVTVSDVNEYGDYFLKLGDNAPTNDVVDDPAAFLIESIGEVHDGANPVADYAKYAAELHMFKSIAPVLDEEDMTYILDEKENYDYAGIVNKETDAEKIAAANEFMALGEMTASSRAFQRLDGKMIRLKNRMPFSRYLIGGTDNALKTGALASNVANSTWVVELPGSTDEEKIRAARMRQITLRNLATGEYIQNQEEIARTSAPVTGADAQTLTVRRRMSFDYAEFYLALTNGYERNTALMMYDNGADTPAASDNTAWGSNSTFYAHWTPETAVSTAAPTVTLTKHSEKDDVYVLTVAKPAGVTAMSLTGIASIGNVTVEKATTARELTEPATVTLTADDEGNITGEIPAQLASATETNYYTVKLPAALLAMDNNVSPAVEANVTVPADPSLTGIKEVNAAEKGVEVIYDLQGRRVSKAGKGVYIINGVKTLVK